MHGVRIENHQAAPGRLLLTIVVGNFAKERILDA